MDRDQAVLLLADGTAPLPLYAWSLVTFLDVAGFVEDANRIGAYLFGGDELLESITHPILIPLMLAEEFLQRPGCHACLDGDQFDAFLGQV